MSAQFPNHLPTALTVGCVMGLVLWLGAGWLRAAEIEPAKALRMSICFNGMWEVGAAGDELKIPETGWRSARVPAVPIVEENVKAHWYRTAFDAPKEWSSPDRRFYLEVEKAGHYAAIFCNGRLVGDHFGQYTPFEPDLTDALRVGEKNDLAIYVHNASGRYVRPGADIGDESIGNAYRPATNQEAQRNWIGLVGDVTFSWRPQTRIADVFVETSVREKTIEVLESTDAPGAEATSLTCRAAVLDGETPVLDLPAATVGADGKARLVARWDKPVLWGSPPYGEPKLYRLRVELLRGGKVIDRTFTRFGFREVWIAGRDVMLNGRKLWMAGTYHSKLSAIRCLNDRRPMAAMIRVMQSSGLNSLHGHWDDLGRTWLELCDEMGMFVLAGFFCDGRPQIQSKADAGWADWMTSTCAEWVRARRNHPSILLWRPTDVLPANMAQFTSREDFCARLAAEVRRNDPSGRPLADGSDVFGWGQSPENKETGAMDNWSPLEMAAKTGKPFLNKEIYGGFQNASKILAFFQTFYRKSFDLGSTGLFVQHLPLMAWRGPQPFEVEWLSRSGPGNRNADQAQPRAELPNWCDPKQPVWIETVYAKAFRDLFKKHMAVDPKPEQGAAYGEALMSGLAPASFVFLSPNDTALAEPQGMVAAPDGTAWFVAQPPGTWRLTHGGGSRSVGILPQPAAPNPGYSRVPRFNAAR